MRRACFLSSARYLLQLGLVILWLGALKPCWAFIPAAQGASPPQAPPLRNIRKQSAVEVLLLDISINGKKLDEVVRAEQVPGGPLLLPAEAWNEARLVPLTHVSALSDGTPAYALDGIAGATWHINRQNLSLDIKAPAGAFIGTTFNLRNTLAAPPPRPRPGVMLDYDLSLNHGGGSSAGGATLEAVTFSGFGNITNSALISDDGKQRSATRLDTYWRYDLPNRMETLIVGDTVGVGGGWSRPARYGGIRWGRDFSMRPGFVTLPQLSLAGEAALPSTVEVLVNNMRRLSHPVQPGPFDLSNVPIVNGAGEIGLVVRDLLGRETVVRQSYYSSPRMLAPGLVDFSFDGGKLRTGYGHDSAYGDVFSTFTWRQGLSASMTGEARLELQKQRRAAGVELTSLLGNWGVGRVALATSNGDTQGPHESGKLLQASIERSTTQGGAALQYERASHDFAPFGEAIDPRTMTQRARERWLASLGGQFWSTVNGSANYVSQTRWDGDKVQAIGLSLGQQLSRQASINISVDKRLDGDRSLSCAVSLNIMLDNGVNAASQTSRSASGQLSSSLSATGSPPAGQGLGWRAQMATVDSQRAQLELQYNTSKAELAFNVASSASGEIATRVGSRGTVGWFEGMAFASRPVGQNSMAVVKVDGIEGVPIKRGNQVVAVTDARGLAFVAGLLPWQKNNIEIDLIDLPMDVEVNDTYREITPFARSGILVNFGARRSRQALLVLRQRDGTPVPIGAKVRLLPAGFEFITGRRGEVWLSGLAEHEQAVQVRWPKGSCTLTLVVPASKNGTPGKIGPLFCEEETSVTSTTTHGMLSQ